MRKVFQVIVSVALMIFLSGCAREMEIVDFKSGVTLYGEYDDLEQTARVTMPNGEVLSGHVTQIKETTYSYTNNSSKDKKKDNFSSTRTTSNVSNAQGLLRSNMSNLIMDLSLTLTGFGGYGTAKTNDGKEYRIQIK